MDFASTWASFWNVTWKFTDRRGQVIEARHLSETDVSGGGSDGSGGVNAVSSSTSHFDRCRVKWDDDGKEDYLNLDQDYSIGDKVVVIYFDNGKYKDQKATDLNLNTGDYGFRDLDSPWYIITAQVVGIILVLGVMLFKGLLALLGLIAAVGGTIYSARYKRSYKASLKEYVDAI
jgi:hypothetical protein